MVDTGDTRHTTYNAMGIWHKLPTGELKTDSYFYSDFRKSGVGGFVKQVFKKQRPKGKKMPMIIFKKE